MRHNVLLILVVIVGILALIPTSTSTQAAPPAQDRNCSDMFARIQVDIAAGMNLKGWLTSVTGEEAQGRVSYAPLIFSPRLFNREGFDGFLGTGDKHLNDRVSTIGRSRYRFDPWSTDDIEIFVSPGMIQIRLLDWGNFTHQFVPECSDGLWYGFGREGRDTSNREMFALYLLTY